MSDHDQVVLDPASYEPPRVERVLTAVELELEVLYAGGPTPPP